VKVIFVATLAPRMQWVQASAGWYVLCNGRVVVSADKTELTGWGEGFPAFHSKFRGFIGIALFLSDDPFQLPWTTSKRGLNRESIVFQQSRNRMKGVARPVISFLDKMYPSELNEAVEQRAIAHELTQRDLHKELEFTTRSSFKAVPKVSEVTTQRVQYDAKIVDLERVRKEPD
jgi:hypothetical protein